MTPSRAFDFCFQHFGLWQDACAMKIGTDGVLLGAWARGGRRIVDVGTGTGLIALMLAQRYASARVWGIELEEGAARQAAANAAASPFVERVTMVHADALQWLRDERASLGPWDAMVSNPPYYTEALPCGSRQRDHARHDEHLPLEALLTVAQELLTPEGQLSMVLPIERWHDAETLVAEQGLYVQRCCHVATKEGKTPKRVLLAVGRQHPHSVETAHEVLTDADGQRSQWYRQLTKEFYLY